MSQYSILVIEDEAIVAMDISNTLESLGYRVLSWLKSGEEALDFLENDLPDLILMDIKLKGHLDGIQTADRIRKKYDLPVIFLTAFSDKETLDRAKMSLPYGYITKSFNINDLRSTMEMALYKHGMEKKLREQQQVLDVSLNNIHAAVITTDRDGKIKFYNRSAETLLRIPRGEKIGEYVDSLDFTLVCKDLDPKKLSLLLPPDRASGTWVCTLHSGSGEEGVPVELSVQVFSNEQGAVLGYVYVLRDIREEIKYNEVQARLASIVEYSDDAVISLALDGTILSWNNTAARMFGYTSDDVVGKNFSILTPAFLPENFPGLLENMIAGSHQDSFETIRERKDGSTLHVSIMLSPIRGQDGSLNGISVVARDITEKRNLEASILEITEKERIRIGQDLHDSLGQHLTGVLLNMKILEKAISKNGSEENLPEARKISSLVKDAIQITRDLAKNLAPPIIESEGFREALKSLANSVEEIYRIDVTLRLDQGQDEPDTGVALQLYRIAQEAVNNAVKHSGASNITIELVMEPRELYLAVTDNGCGLKRTSSGGMGISIMNYRADMINGTLSLTHSPDGGTRVSCRIPLQKEPG